MSTLLTPKQVAERLVVSPRTVYSWIEEGRLPSVRLSERVTRVPAEAVDAMVAAALRPARTPRSLLAAEERGEYGGSPVLSCMRCGSDVDPRDGRSATERLLELLARHRDEILALAARSGVTNVRVFGSVARGDAHPGSDIDLLVDLEPGSSLFDLSGFQLEVADILNWEVDVGTESSLKPERLERILREAVPL